MMRQNRSENTWTSGLWTLRMKSGTKPRRRMLTICHERRTGRSQGVVSMASTGDVGRATQVHEDEGGGGGGR